MGSEGVLNCAAPANNNWNIDQVGDIPCSCSSDYLISVTNTTSSDVKYTDAGYRVNSIDIGAPGTNIYSTLPGDTYGYQTGTSMTCPQVAGVIALMYASMCQNMILDYKSDPENFALNIRSYLLNGADNIPSLAGLLAHGRLNALEAIENIYGNSSTISGPSLICTSGTFTVNNPSGATVSWNESSNLTESPTGTFTANGSGSGWVEATLITDCGSVTLPRKTVWVGAPDPDYIDFINIGPNYPGSMVLCDDMPNDGKVDWDATGSILEYSWRVRDDGSNYWQVIQHPMSLPLIPMQDVQFSKPYGSVTGYVNVTVRARNTCGWGNYSAPALQFTTTSCYGYYMMVSPNPARDETTIGIEQGDPEATIQKSASTEITFDENAEWDLEVYDNAQSLKLKKQKLKGRSARINTQNWKDGVYMVRVKYKDEILTAKLVVEQ